MHLTPNICIPLIDRGLGFCAAGDDCPVLHGLVARCPDRFPLIIASFWSLSAFI